MNPDEQPFQLRHFVETETYRTVKEAADHTILLRRPALVYGEASLGKSVALLKIATETGAKMFEVNATNKGVGAMLKSFIRAFDGYPRGRATGDLLEECEYLAKEDTLTARDGWGSMSAAQYRQSRLLLVDEYQNLEPLALRLLLGICIKMELPLLLCGNSERLASHSRDAKLAMAQLSERMLLHFHVGPPSARDCRDIGIHFNVEGKEAYESIAAFGCQTNLRRLVDLLQKAAVNTGGNGGIKRINLENALLTYGGEKLLHLLSPKAAHLAELGGETGNPKR